MSEDDFNEFKQEAVGEVNDLWFIASGKRLDSDELQDLNALLDNFFESKR